MNATRQNIVNFIKAGKILANIKELNNNYHRDFDCYYKRPNHLHIKELVRFNGETVSKGELVAALHEYEEDTEISINTFGDYEWGYDIRVTTEEEIPYSDEEWLQEIIDSDIKMIGLGLGRERSLMSELNRPDMKTCKDYDAMVIIARSLHDMHLSIEEFVALDLITPVHNIITYRLLARLFVEMYSNRGDYLSKTYDHSKFYADLFGDADPTHYPLLIYGYAKKIVK